ncbi:MAG: hypothetical protein KAV41_02625 [Candidatus Pacebacteria bacterium]|nr:hypothetical protein [Candidatus Paceibacterota bacterium]
MKKKSYYNDDICIVGLGCVLPDANNPQEFWNNLLAGNCSIKQIPDERWKSSLYLSPDKKAKDKTYSNFAAVVENNCLRKICDKLGLDFSKNNRLQIMTLEATKQVFDCLKPKTLKEARKNTSVFLGCVNADELLVKQVFFLHNKKSLEKYIDQNGLKDKNKILKKIKEHFTDNNLDKEDEISSLLSTSVINLIKQKFHLQGEGALVDAACSSSLAALNIAVRNLRGYKTDLAIAGGIESNLGPGTFVLFSKVRALSKGCCHPFDERADGLSQGEGAAVFALQRMEDALRDKNKIYGIIKSTGGSSDGKSSSLFSPAVEGQLLAYKRAYKNLDKNSMDYIECHGTGTKIGDATELKSLTKFFGKRKIPIGSVKSLIGHTKGAAGAAGLLKCVLSLQHKIIPPSKYLKSPLSIKDVAVYVNKKPLKLKDKQIPLRFGISSFGFGNINYHIVLDEFSKDGKIIKRENNKPENPIVILGDTSAPLNKVDFDLMVSKFKISRRSLPCIDKVQLQALSVVAKVFEKLKIDIHSLDSEKVSVISATNLGLEASSNFGNRIRHFEFKDALNFLDKKSVDLMIKHKNKFPKVTEDTGPGVLNNVIAGRVCNTFDFWGENFNIDSDFNSFSVALNVAVQKLQTDSGLLVLLLCDDKLNRKKLCLDRTKVSCLALSTLNFAKEKNYPIQEVLEKVDYSEVLSK